MSVVKRTVVSNPERTSVETWVKITEIICGQNAEAKKEFVKVSNVTASLLSEEFMKDNPLVVKGSGAQLRIYSLYGEDAISGEDSNEESLSWDITSKPWMVYLPCSKDELSWYEKTLSGLSDKFKVYDRQEGIDKEEYQSNNFKESEFNIDEEAFKKL